MSRDDTSTFDITHLDTVMHIEDDEMSSMITA